MSTSASITWTPAHRQRRRSQFERAVASPRERLFITNIVHGSRDMDAYFSAGDDPSTEWRSALPQAPRHERPRRRLFGRTSRLAMRMPPRSLAKHVPYEG